jgi:hypothetical protein
MSDIRERITSYLLTHGDYDFDNPERNHLIQLLRDCRHCLLELETLLDEYKDAECRAVKRHGEALTRVAELKALLRVAECPWFCEGVLVVSAAYELPDGEIEYELSRCQFCAERDALLENNDE